MLQKMNGIREMQEKLTLKHFEIDQVRINQERKVSATEEVKDDLSLHELTQALEALGNEIQSLSTDIGGPKQAKQTKKVTIRDTKQDEPLEGRTTPL
eukprot:Em0023g657a